MAIYRGSGGSTSTTDQATIDQVAEDAATATTKAAEAASSASAAASSASSASSSATSASSSASTATTKASEASTSATNAASSASAASTSATSAASSATSASGSATNAASEAAAALSSKALALDAQTAAEAAEANAILMNEDAQKSAYGAEDALQTLSDSSTLYSARHYAAKANANQTAAEAAQTAAETAQAAAEEAQADAVAALEAINGSYLGVQTSDPTLDLNGEAITKGDWYYNETTDVTRIYDGSVWVNGAVDTSSFLLSGNNLSDLGDAVAARTNLGVAIGTDVLAYDSTVVYDADIGVNVQAYSSVLANTTASYTTAEETKLAGIETAATADQTAQEIATAIDADATAEATLKSALGLGTAAYTASTAYATAAQGALADSALQSGDNISTLTNDSGYLTSFTETDPVYTASSWYTTTNNSANWDTAYGWGDHSTEGYLTGNQTITLSGDVSGSGTTSITVTVADDSHNHVISNIDNLQTTLDAKASTGKAIAMAIVFGG
jgi:hypothetical protein